MSEVPPDAGRPDPAPPTGERPAGERPAFEEAGTRFALQGDEAATRSAERRIAVCWAITAASALSLAGVYIAGGQPQAEGALLAVAFGSLGIGFILLARELLPGSEVTGPRHDMGSSPEAQEAVEDSLARGEGAGMVRRSFLVRMLALAGGSLGIAALFPINSLGPHPGNSLYHTSWSKGLRLRHRRQPAGTSRGAGRRRRDHRVPGRQCRRCPGPDPADQPGRGPPDRPGRAPDVVGVGLCRLLEGVHPRRLSRSVCTARRATSCSARATSRPSTCSRPAARSSARRPPPCPSCPSRSTTGLPGRPERLHRARRPGLLGPAVKLRRRPTPDTGGGRAGAAHGPGRPLDR